MEPNDLRDSYREFTQESLNELRETQRRLARKKESAKESTSLAKSSILEAFGGRPSVEDEDEEIDVLHPDPTLQDGEELAPGQFKKKLLNKPVEDLDPYYRQHGIETFCIVTKRFGKNHVYRFSATKSLFLLSAFNRLRYWLIRTIIHPAFDAFILTVILINCVFLALDNEIEDAEFVFTAVYTVELVVKIIAKGFIINPFSYLRDPWNWLDFIVVVLAYVTIAGTGANVSSLRTLRVLRAFKSVSIIPGLRIIVNSLFHSMQPLAEVLLIMLFLVIVVGLIALQAYQGVLRRRCVRFPTQSDGITSDLAWQTYVTNPSNWNPVDGELIVCGNSSGSGFCPTNYICLGDVGPNPNFGYTSFDHMGLSLLTSFQLITLDFWENVYNMIIRAEGPWNILFFLVSVLLGPFYLLNLLLAVITLAYSKEVDQQKEFKKNRAELQKQALNKKQARKRNRQAQAAINAISPKPDDSQTIPEPIVIGNLNASSEIDVNHSLMKNDQATKRREMFKASKQQNVSLESDYSGTSGQPKWKERWERFKTWYMDTFCHWKCSFCFEDFQTLLLSVVEFKAFEYFIMFSIITNTIFLAIDHHGISDELESALNIGNTVFTGIFAVEAALKILAYGPVTYAKSLWNVFDFIIVIVSLVELFLEVSGGGEGNGLSVLRTLRLLATLWYRHLLVPSFSFAVIFQCRQFPATQLRICSHLMRVFRLARMWGTMQKLVEIIWKTLGAVGYLTIVLFLILYIYAVIGKQVFGTRYAANGSRFDDNLTPRWNFVDFYHSFLLVWRVMCGEWIEPLHECLHITDGDGFCIAFFLLVFFVSNFLVLNLFTAILLAAFNVDNIKNKKETQEKVSKQKRLALKVIAKFRENVRKKKAMSNTVEPAPIESEPVKKDPNSFRDLAKNISSRPLNRAPKSIYELTLILQARNREAKESDMKKSSPGFIDDRSSYKLSPASIRRPFSGKRPISGQTRESGFIISNPSLVSDNWTRKANGHLHHSHASLRSADYHSISFCSKFYCCCTVPTDHEVIGDDARSRTSSNATRNSVTIVQNMNASENSSDSTSTRSTSTSSRSTSSVVSTLTVVQSEEDLEDPLSEWTPPNCLPKFLLNKYPRLKSYPPTSQVYTYWMKIRMACYKLVSHNYFEWFILVLILASTVSLAMEDFYLSSDPIRMQVLQKLEYVFTALFTLEMLLKWIGLGVTDYFTSVWCVLDCAIVAASWAGIILQATNQNTQTGAFRSLRTLRALRPLRAVSRWEGMRAVVNSLIYCIPSIGNVICVCLLIWFVFSIMGVQFFKGRFRRCVDADDEPVDDPLVTNRVECGLNNYTWINPNINFDNVLIGMVALFQVATFEGWIEVMSDANDVTGIDLQPVRENSQYNIIFFVVFVLVGSFFILNLIIGVIIESFQKLRNQTDTSPLETMMTENQKRFYKTVKTMMHNKPKGIIPMPKNKFQLGAYKLVTNTKFELVIFILICLNMVTLSMEHYQMTQEWINSLRIVDIIFTTLFAIEAISKIIGLREYYFKDAFNAFDFLIVALSVAGFVLESLVTSLNLSPTLLRIVRVFRVFRVLRVIRAARGIRRLILTLLVSVPALFNIAILLGVFLIIFAILGMNLFMNVQLMGALNNQVNFRTFGSSLLLLFRLVTSAGWNDVLDPLMNTRNCNLPSANDPGNCGDPIVAVIYFIMLILLIFLVIINMYIAVILENFEDILLQDESGITSGDFEEFYAVWAHYDPNATQFVTLTKLSNLLDCLRPPFQIPKPNEIKISALELPIFSGERVHCLDVLFALVKRLIGDVEISPEIKQQAEAMMQKYFPNRIELEANTTTLILRKQVKAAKFIQKLWRERIEQRKNPQSSALGSLTMQLLVQSKSGAQESSSNEPKEVTILSKIDETKTVATNKIPQASNSDASKPPGVVIVEESVSTPRPKTVHLPAPQRPQNLVARPQTVAENSAERGDQDSAQQSSNKPPLKAKLQNFVTEAEPGKTNS